MTDVGCCRWTAEDRPDGTRSMEAIERAIVDGILSRRRRDAEDDLMRETSGAPLCRLDERGRVSGAKHAEGRVGALADVRRRLGSAQAPPPLALVRDLAETWRLEHARAEQRGVAWLAYRSGGADELEAMIGELEGFARSPHR